MSISKFNHVSPFTFKLEVADPHYYSLRQLYESNGADRIYTFLALFISNKGKFGDQPIATTSHYYVNLPKHLVDDCRAMIADPETVQQINAGKAGFRIRKYFTKNNQEAFSVEWVDIKEEAFSLEWVDIKEEDLPF